MVPAVCSTHDFYLPLKVRPPAADTYSMRSSLTWRLLYPIAHPIGMLWRVGYWLIGLCGACSSSGCEAGWMDAPCPVCRKRGPYGDVHRQSLGHLVFGPIWRRARAIWTEARS
jgi:hypothetical protein